MYIANVTNDCDNITSSNTTYYGNITHNRYKNILNDYDNMTQTTCTINENNIDIIIPSLLLTIPCCL